MIETDQCYVWRDKVDILASAYRLVNGYDRKTLTSIELNNVMSSLKQRGPHRKREIEADRQDRSGRERPRVPPSDSKDAVNDGGCDHQGQAAGDGYNCSIETPLGEPDSEADKQEDDGDGLPQGALGPARELGVQFVEGLHVPRGSCLGVQNKKACGDLVFL